MQILFKFQSPACITPGTQFSCQGINVRLLRTTFKRGAENGFLQFADMCRLTNVVHWMLKLTIVCSECFPADHLHCAVWIICTLH